MSEKKKRKLPVDMGLITPMTQAEFDWAWEQSPDWRVAELYGLPDAPIILGKPLDRAWRYVGKIGGTHADYRVPCSCRKPDYALSAEEANKKLREYKKYPIAVCPAGVIHVGKKHYVYYVGMCEECHVVYWLTEDEG